MQFDIKNFKTPFFKYVIGLCALAMFSVIGVYSYLGIYSRYLADDYCETNQVRSSNPFLAVINRYEEGISRANNRYSNLLFVGFSEWLGKYSIQITTSSMVVIWIIGLIWGIHEFRKALGIHWPRSMDYFFGTALGVFSLLQAANLYQDIHWRSGLMVHFAPLVFGTFLSAFLLRQARAALSKKTSWPVYPFLFLATFIIAGFSEPPATTILTGTFLVMLAVWIWGTAPFKQRISALLAFTFAGALLGLLVMFFSPAAANTWKDTVPGVVEIFINSFFFTWVFIADSIKVFPVPILISILTPGLLIWLYRQTRSSELSPEQKRIVWIVVVLAPIILWILIAAGFSPSVYGQSYPVARMRILARTLMTATIMLEGGLFGLLAEKFQFKPSRKLGQWIVITLMIVVGFIYPVRAAITIYRNSILEYRSYAEAWDQRDAQIREAVAQGATDLTVVQLDTMHGIQEYKKNNWVNRCAEKYYGLHTLSAP